MQDRDRTTPPPGVAGSAASPANSGPITCARAFRAWFEPPRRTHLVTPGQPCLVCNRQLDPAHIQADKLGLFNDPSYIRGAAISAQPRRQNVAILAASVSLLAQFTSQTVAPAGMGGPGPLRHALSTHTLEHLDIPLRANCPFQTQVSAGGGRIPLTGSHDAARKAQEERRARQNQPAVRLRRQLAEISDWLNRR